MIRIWESFKKCYLLLCDKYIPSKIAKSRCSLSWITNSIKKLMEAEVKHWVQNEMRVAYYSYIHNIISPSSADGCTFLAIKNLVIYKAS